MAIEPVVSFRYGPTLEIGAVSHGSGGDAADPLASIGDLTWTILASSSFETPAWLALSNGLPWDTDFREGADLLGAEGPDPSLRFTGESASLLDPAQPSVSDHANASQIATAAVALPPTPSSVARSQRTVSAQHWHEGALPTPTEADRKSSESLSLESKAGQSKPRGEGAGPPQSSQLNSSEPPHTDHTYNVSAPVEVGANNLTAPSAAEAPAAAAAPSAKIDPLIAATEADMPPPAAGPQAPPTGPTAQSSRSQPGEAVAIVSSSATPGDRTPSALPSATGPASREKTLEPTARALPIVPATAKSGGPPPAGAAASPPAAADRDTRVSASRDRPPAPIVAKNRLPDVSSSSAVDQSSAALPGVRPVAHASDGSELSMPRAEPSIGDDDAIGAKSRPVDASPMGDTARDSARATAIVPYRSEAIDRPAGPIAPSAPRRNAAVPVSGSTAETYESARQPQRQRGGAANSFDTAQASPARPHNVKPGDAASASASASASEPPPESRAPEGSIDDRRSAQSHIAPAQSPKIFGARQLSPPSAEHHILPDARSPRSNRSDAVVDSDALSSPTPSKAAQTMLGRPQLRSGVAAGNGLRADRAAAQERIVPLLADEARPRQRAANATSAIGATSALAAEMPASPATAGATSATSATSVVVPSAAPSKSSAMPQRDESEAAPIRISIGRISVDSPVPSQPKHAARARPKMSLGDYLKRRRDSP